MRRNNAVSVLAISGAAVLVLAGCSSTDGDEGGSANAAGPATSFRVAFNQNAEHPQALAIAELSDNLSEATDGAYELELYPDEQLGAQAETLELVQSGAIDMAIIAGPLMEAFNPDFAVLNLPYLYDSADHQMSVLNDDDVTGELYDSLAESEKLTVIGAYHGGVRNVYSTDAPVEEPSDLAGQKIRVIASDTNIEMMRLMGGVGTPLAQGEVYTAIQSGVLDGGENNELIYADLAHAEIAPFYSYTKHLMIPDYLVVNSDVLAAMSDDDREELYEQFEASIETELASFDEKIEAAKEKAEAAGATFNEVDIEVFRDAVSPLLESKIDNEVTQAIFDKVEAAR